METDAKLDELLARADRSEEILNVLRFMLETLRVMDNRITTLRQSVGAVVNAASKPPPNGNDARLHM